jgi:hypothetical protein
VTSVPVWSAGAGLLLRVGLVDDVGLEDDAVVVGAGSEAAASLPPQPARRRAEATQRETRCALDGARDEVGMPGV